MGDLPLLKLYLFQEFRLALKLHFILLPFPPELLNILVKGSLNISDSLLVVCHYAADLCMLPLSHLPQLPFLLPHLPLLLTNNATLLFKVVQHLIQLTPHLVVLLA